MGYIYILKNFEGKFYVGSTSDLERRIKQHKAGHTHSTHRMGELTLVFWQKFNSLVEARKIEIKLKKLKRKDYIEKIVKDRYIKMMPK